MLCGGSAALAFAALGEELAVPMLFVAACLAALGLLFVAAELAVRVAADIRREAHQEADRQLPPSTA